MAKGWKDFTPERDTHSQAAREAAAAASEDYVRLNLEVPRALRAELRKRAIDEGLSMKELGTKILASYLND